MSAMTLRLVSETDRTPDVFKLEKRREPRHRLYARVTAVAERPETPHAVDGQGAGQICALELVDRSASGLGAWSIAPVAMGSRVTVFFPAHGNTPGHNAIGRVVRCTGKDGGFSIGLRLANSVAAA